ncbi:hypothetical protein SSX86_000799 [Deinandra increscens subsp. villosa]|uniref:Protein ENHANCED DISEASE RESISTANCE 2 C-terminal domain-containing protein n=1 Tax=Deinandra increscens subsp. villosa TaxID=3103831 RepID=A0AAP0DQF7_9ASTR
MAVEAQIKEDTMAELDKAPSILYTDDEKEEEDEYFSDPDPDADPDPDSVDEILSENSWSDSSPQTLVLKMSYELKSVHSTAQKKDDTTEDIEWQDSFLSNNDASFPNDPTGELPNSWGAAEASVFHIRGETYLKDRKKTTRKGTLMQLVASNLLKSVNKQGDFAGRPGSICQKFAAADRPDFFFVVNMQIPGSSTNFHIAFYYATTTPIKDVPLLENFVEGDDAYRNARFKLIPHVSKVGTLNPAWAMDCKAKCWKQALPVGTCPKHSICSRKELLRAPPSRPFPQPDSDLIKPSAVAPPSGQQQQSSNSNLTRRRTASSNSPSSRPSAPTRIIYRETLGPSSESVDVLDSVTSGME